MRTPPRARLLRCVCVVAVTAALMLMADCSSDGGPTVEAPAKSPLPFAEPEDPPVELASGTWTMVGSDAFMPGLTITLPTGWSIGEHTVGELSLIPGDHPRDRLFLWKDLAAVKSDGTAKLVGGVPRTVDGLTSYFRSHSEYVVSTSRRTTIGEGLPALTYVVGASRSAAFVEKDCPSYPRCVALFTDPDYWAGNFYAIGAPEVVRLYLATVGAGENQHLFVVGLDATDTKELVRLTKVAQPILASIRLPARLN